MFFSQYFQLDCAFSQLAGHSGTVWGHTYSLLHSSPIHHPGLGWVMSVSPTCINNYSYVLSSIPNSSWSACLNIMNKSELQFQSSCRWTMSIVCTLLAPKQQGGCWRGEPQTKHSLIANGLCAPLFTIPDLSSSSQRPESSALVGIMAADLYLENGVSESLLILCCQSSRQPLLTHCWSALVLPHWGVMPLCLPNFQGWINSRRSCETHTPSTTTSCWTSSPECPPMCKW